jgi:AAA domain
LDFSSETQVALQNNEFVFDGDAPIDPPRMLVKGLLPASGLAFIGGQSGAGKTFVAVALGAAQAGGTEFFKCQVKKRVGVLYIAAEGGASFAARVAAAMLAADIKGRSHLRGQVSFHL